MFEYDIAISFAGKDRDIASALYTQLHTVYGYKVFYDTQEKALLTGAYLPEYLIDIFRNKARYCIVLISKSYKEGKYTRHEWRAAQTRAFDEPDIEYIIPVKVDETELEGLLPTRGFISLKDHTVQEVAKIVHDKLRSEVDLLHMIRIADSYYLENKFQEALDKISDKIFDDNPDALRIRGNAYGKLHRYEEAIEAFRKIADKFPDDFLAQFHLGIYYYRTGDMENSVKHYEIADKLYPNHPTIKEDLPYARKKLKASRRKQ